MVADAAGVSLNGDGRVDQSRRRRSAHAPAGARMTAVHVLGSGNELAASRSGAAARLADGLVRPLGTLPPETCCRCEAKPRGEVLFRGPPGLVEPDLGDDLEGGGRVDPIDPG